MTRTGGRGGRAMGVGAAALLCAAALLAATAPASQAACSTADVLCAGAASVDMTWHVGAGQGQYGSPGNGYTAGRWDPFHHQAKQVPSHGVQSRTFAKAVVVRGPDGGKVAYVKTELYLQQDVLTRRVGELLAGDPVAPEYAVDGLDASRVMLGATHNHSVPMYASTAFGVWLFTDTFDFRMFEATARRIAAAVKEADARLQPARVGASVTRFDDVQQNILGPAVADDGSPAGFPRDHFDDELAVIRFEALDGSGAIAAWVNLGMHPESQGTTDMISSDFVGQVERMVERDLGGEPADGDGPVVVWSQGSVGDVEPDSSRANPPAAGRQYWHEDYQQMERMSRDVADAVLDTWRDVARPSDERGGDHVAEKFVAFDDRPVVRMSDHRFEGPVSHPAPTISNCRTERPGVPVVGLPDCERPGEAPEQLGESLDLLHDHGVPVPDNYGVPSHGGVHESLRIHLQVIRIGEIVLGSCPCEPTSDMTLNFKTRADADRGDMYLGYEWPCREAGDGGVECDFRQAGWREADWRPVDREAYELMRAQIRNDAAGWEEDAEHLQGEAEHGERDDGHPLYGNFTHDELDAGRGYRLPLMVGQANDYIGYIVSYREYMSHDHYRKALTAFGPHTADYVNTRLMQMAAELRGGSGPRDAVHGPAVGALDELMQSAKTLAVGKGASAGIAAYEAAIPDDGGTPGKVLLQPDDLQRFGEAKLRWEGGSNWTDNPRVRVERRGADGSWTTVGVQDGGEIVVTLEYESALSSAPLDWLAGAKRYEWTARYEVFDRTEPGTYRFVVDGRHREGRQANPYQVVSEPFEVSVWEGIAAHDLDVEGDTASVRVDGTEGGLPPERLETDADARLAGDEVHYPDTYHTDGPYIQERYEQIGPHVYCFRCSYRPWADSGRIERVLISVRRAAGGTTTHPAAFDGERWVAGGLALQPGDVVVVERGGAVDEHGNVNGEPSNQVTAGSP